MLLFYIAILVGNFATERTVALALTSPATNKRNAFRTIATTSTSISLSTFKIAVSLQRRQGVLVVDVENVRGKSGFALSHADLLDRLTDWTSSSVLSNHHHQQQQQQQALQVILVVDHGNQPHAYHLASSGLAVVFAGPSQKADDVIANDIGKIAQWTRDYHQQQHHTDDEEEEATGHNHHHHPVMVVTDDQGLLRRCRKSTAARKRLEVVSPLSLLEELEQFAARTVSPNNNPTLPHVMAAAKEIAWGAEWLLAHSKVQAAKTKHIPNKRRQSLHQQVTLVQRQLETTNVGRSVHQLVQKVADIQTTNVSDNDNDKNHDTNDDLDLDPLIQTAVLESWEQLQQSLRYRSFKKEKTDDRVVLAEDFRKILHERFQDVTHELFQDYHQSNNHQNVNNDDTNHVDGRALLPPTQAYVCDWIWRYGSSRSLLVSSKTSNLHLTSSSSAAAQTEAEATAPQFSTPTLRLVVISDTHGMEDQLGPLPHGDVLLHLGDFALEGPAKILSAKAFDQWLSRQPHPYKIVLRGNHDPRGSLLPVSGAMYVTSPRTIHMAGFSIALVPFVSRLTKQCLPSTCDILASHVPPMNTLDTCTSGKSAGSNVLRKRLRQMGAKSGSTTTLHRNHYLHHQKQQQQHHPSNMVETITHKRKRKSKGPRLVLCGHIHESRGWMWQDFSSSSVTRDATSLDTQDDDDHNPTLVVNAANANAGFAREIQHGPVVLELSKSVLEDGSLSDTQMTLHMDDEEQTLKPTGLVGRNEST